MQSKLVIKIPLNEKVQDETNTMQACVEYGSEREISQLNSVETTIEMEENTAEMVRVIPVAPREVTTILAATRLGTRTATCLRIAIQVDRKVRAHVSTETVQVDEDDGVISTTERTAMAYTHTLGNGASNTGNSARGNNNNGCYTSRNTNGNLSEDSNSSRPEGARTREHGNRAGRRGRRRSLNDGKNCHGIYTYCRNSTENGWHDCPLCLSHEESDVTENVNAAQFHSQRESIDHAEM